MKARDYHNGYTPGRPIPDHPSAIVLATEFVPAPADIPAWPPYAATEIEHAISPYRTPPDESVERTSPFPVQLHALAVTAIERVQTSRRQFTDWIGNMAVRAVKLTIDTQTWIEHNTHSVRARSERREAYRTLEEWWNVLAYYQENLPRPYATALTWLTVTYSDPSNGQMVVDHLYGRGAKLQRDMELFGTAHPGTRVLDIRIGSGLTR